MPQALAYIAAVILTVWGLAHLAATRPVVASFGPISADGRRILEMEWVAESVTMLFIAALVAAVTLAGDGPLDTVYRVSAIALLAMGALTAATGARTPVAWFKACPVVMTVCAGLILLAG